MNPGIPYRFTIMSLETPGALRAFQSALDNMLQHGRITQLAASGQNPRDAHAILLWGQACLQEKNSGPEPTELEVCLYQTAEPRDNILPDVVLDAATAQEFQALLAEIPEHKAYPEIALRITSAGPNGLSTMIELIQQHLQDPEALVEAACRNVPRFDEDLQACVHTTNLEARVHLHRSGGTSIIWQIEHEEVNETAQESLIGNLLEIVHFSQN